MTQNGFTMITVTNELTVEYDSAVLVRDFINVVTTYDKGNVGISDNPLPTPGLWLIAVNGENIKEVKKATKWVLKVAEKAGLKVSE